ncbi:MAG: M56 family metallopeptidase [Firmicutes bacterium]|nr:M56 family metallopeptidase [Bacillota bacterium]
MPLPQSILLDKVVPSIIEAAVTLLLVLTILKLFRIKDHAIRFVFLFLPLIKAQIAFTEGGSWHPSITFKRFILSLRFDDPLGLINLRDNTLKYFDPPQSFTVEYSVIKIGLLLATVSVVLIMVARWVQLFCFLSSFKKETRLSRDDYPQIYAILNRLADKLKVKQPELVVTTKYHFVPFSIGHKMPIIVISQALIDSFSEEQLEIMLAHELAHIKRYDNLTGWISLILRDLLFFNPIVYPIYHMIEEEKEMACDRVALEKTGLPAVKIAGALLDVAIFRRNIESTQKVLYPALAKGFLYRHSVLKRRVDSITEQKADRCSFLPLRLLKGFLIAFAAIAILFIHPVLGFVFKGNLIIILH